MLKYLKDAQNIENVTNRLNNNTNNGQVFANSDYTVNTESLVGKPSSYFQNNNSVFVNDNTSGLGNNNTSGWSNNINDFGNQNNDGWNYTTDLQKQQCIDSSGMQCTPQNNNNKNMTSMYPDYSQPASLEFDGQNVVWLQNGQPVKYYPAMSGKPDHQTAADTDIPNAGPIPEGDYLLAQGSGQDYNNKEELSLL